MGGVVVYIDSVLALNLAADYLLLLCCARLCGMPFRRLRILAGALVGAVYSAAVFFFPIEGVAFRLCVASVMVYLALGSTRFFRSVLLFLGISCAFAGCVLGLGAISGSTRLLTHGVFYADINWNVFLISAMAAYMVLALVFRGGVRHTGGELMQAEICAMDRCVTLGVLHDTGNTLCDPLTGKSVLIVWEGALRGLWDADTRRILSTLARSGSADVFERLPSPQRRRFRLIPYRAVGVEHGLLLVWQSECVRLDGREYKALSVALSPTALSDGGAYEGLWGGETGKGAGKNDIRMAAWN